MRSVEFEVPGVAVPKQSMKVARRGKFISTYTPAHVKEWQDLVRRHAVEACEERLCGPLFASLSFWYPMQGQPRKRKPRPPRVKDTRPDCDNLSKPVLDAMNGIVYEDDGQVARLLVEKYRCPQVDNRPRVEVKLFEMTDP